MKGDLVCTKTSVWVDEPVGDLSGSLRVTLSEFPLEEDLGKAIVSAASQHTACLARMEEAMKEMEYFVGALDFGKRGDRLRIYNDMTTDQHWYTAGKLWYEAKRECWSKP